MYLVSFIMYSVIVLFNAVIVPFIIVSSFMLNVAEHDNFSAYKYKNDNRDISCSAEMKI